MNVLPNSLVLFLDDSPERTRYFKSFFPWCDTVSTAEECIEALKSKEYDYFFSDHDLGGQHDVSHEKDGTGSEVCRFIVDNKIKIGTIIVHSLNTVASTYMERLLKDSGYNVVLVPFIRLFR